MALNSIHFAEAIPIACLGLAMNIASAWLLSGEGHHHGHTHEGHDHDDAHHLTTGAGGVVLEVFEDGVPPRFRLRSETEAALVAQTATIETVRPDGSSSPTVNFASSTLPLRDWERSRKTFGAEGSVRNPRLDV